jgi:phenylalanyl-tRNA synthetase beta chain
MYLPLSWLKDYISLDGLSIEDLARLLTSAGLEVESIQIIGLPLPPSLQDPSARHEFKISGLDWDPDKIIVAEIDEVMPHPNADRLTLCRLNDGQKEYIVLTGAPNLFPYKGQGPLAQPLKVAYAREGSRIYDGHQPGQVLTTLKRTKIRGVESFSMVCSEKELGISEEHEGIMVLDPNAPAGMPLAEYMGDAVFEVKILPNMIRNASVLGIAREQCPGCRHPGPRRHPDHRSGPESPLCPRPDREREARLQPVLGAAPPAPVRNAPDQ